MTAGVRHTGRLVTWNDDRGFGFIHPDGDGGREVFVHISAFAPHATRPEEGVRLSYELADSGRGRVKAVEVKPVGIPIGKPGGERLPIRLGTLGYLAIAAFIPIYVVATVAWHLPPWVHALYLATSVGCFAAYALDKSAAVRGGWRLAERSLLLLGLVGGWPGAIVAQQLFRHKTRKKAFLAQFWASVALNVIAFVVLASPVWHDLFVQLTGSAG